MRAFAGKRVAVVGGGQSAFESAVLMNERGADVELIARGPEIVWLRSWSPIHFMGRLGKVVYAPTDVGPLWYSRLVATPALFTRLPARDAGPNRVIASIRPACSYFVKVRVDGVRLTTATEVTGAKPAGEGLELTLSDGSTREVDHLMFGTGYKVNVERYPFLGEDLLADLGRRRLPGAAPRVRELVPGLHILGRAGGPELWPDDAVRVGQLVRRYAARSGGRVGAARVACVTLPPMTMEHSDSPSDHVLARRVRRGAPAQGATASPPPFSNPLT